MRLFGAIGELPKPHCEVSQSGARSAVSEAEMGTPRAGPLPGALLLAGLGASAAIYMVINFPVMYVQLFFHLLFPGVLHMCIFNGEKFRKPFCQSGSGTLRGRDVVP